MGESKQDSHRQHGGPRPQLLDQQLKGITAKQDLLASRPKKKYNQEKQQTRPGKLSSRPKVKVRCAGKQ